MSRMSLFLTAVWLLATLNDAHADLPGAPNGGSSYRFWTAAQVGAVTPGPEQKLPPPAGFAFLVTRGYLIALASAFGEVAVRYDLDATVHIHDGTRWQVGRLVDVDSLGLIALIRSDVGGVYRPLPRSALRDFIEQYFRSWGQLVRPRPNLSKGGRQ